MTKRRIALEPRKYWTAEEDTRLAAAWEDVRTGKRTARQLLSEFPGRTLQSIRARASMTKAAGDVPAKKLPDDWQERFRQWHALGWTDADIADETQVTRRYVSFLRKQMGLPSNQFSQKRIEAVRAKTAEKLAAAGVDSLGKLRAVRFQQFAIERGWPADLRVRGVQILELLLVEPALTRREICERIGVPWKGSKKSLVSNDPEGTYLSNLAVRGLVIKSPRVYLGEKGKHKGKGKTVCYYSASPLAHQMKAEFLQVQDSQGLSRSNGHGKRSNITGDGHHTDQSAAEPVGVSTAAAAGLSQADRRTAGSRRRQAAQQG